LKLLTPTTKNDGHLKIWNSFWQGVVVGYWKYAGLSYGIGRWPTGDQGSKKYVTSEVTFPFKLYSLISHVWRSYKFKLQSRLLRKNKMCFNWYRGYLFKAWCAEGLLWACLVLSKVTKWIPAVIKGPISVAAMS